MAFPRFQRAEKANRYWYHPRRQGKMSQDEMCGVKTKVFSIDFYETVSTKGTGLITAVVKP